jgi:hypothetical protein
MSDPRLTATRRKSSTFWLGFWAGDLMICLMSQALGPINSGVTSTAVLMLSLAFWQWTKEPR